MTAITVDGKKWAQEIRAQIMRDLERSGKSVTLGIVMAGADAATRQFVRMKRTAAEEVGIRFEKRVFSADVTTDVLIEAVRELAGTSTGIVVQLPLPAHIDTAAVLAAIPPEKDVDVLSGESWRRFAENAPGALVPPVAGAIAAILNHHCPDGRHRKSFMVVVGSGKLVGKPCEILFKRLGYDVRAVNLMTPPDEARAEIAAADILISGAGSPHFISPDMIKHGVAIIDAGTSESNGAIVGDVDPSCAEKAWLMTPTPGGVGPVAVAMLLKNLTLAR